MKVRGRAGLGTTTINPNLTAAQVWFCLKFLFEIWLFFLRALGLSSWSQWCWCLLSLAQPQMRTTHPMSRYLLCFLLHLFSVIFNVALLSLFVESLSNICCRVLPLLPLDCPSQPATSLQFLSLGPGLNHTKSSTWYFMIRLLWANPLICRIRFLETSFQINPRYD